ncbi:MAG: family 10 glycosylhydrolase, partial [Oscillospiraceae bacterium]|nr:family 10 glycosylhydrolase [Oscillospiraceae bacterium]
MKTKSRLIISALLMCALIGSGIFLIYNIAGAPGAPPYYARGAEAMPISFDIYTPSPGGEEEPYEAQPIFEVLPSEFRGVWVTTVINLDFPTAPGISAEAMKQEIDEIVARTVELGLNTIIFQVRPTGDAFYESDIFPWSHWLSGTQGVGISDFDPLAYWIEVSHANNLELHAWINPYRIIHTITNSSDPNTLYENHPVRLRPELAVGWTDNNGRSGLFLDPGLPEARQLIIDGIENLIRNYAVDGIHFDDYFYPDTNFDDAASFERYGDGMDLHYWRRENVNTLVRDIQSKIRSLNEELDRDVTWGISPTAIWKNETSHPLGVPTTRGMESFHALYADTRLWVTDEMVDYIMPQIYWYIGFAIADFEAVFTWWEDLCRDSDVDLIIGHAAWREEDNHGPNWQGEMVRQMQMVTDSDVAQGSVFFRSNHLRGAVGDAIRDFYFDLDDTMVIREPVIILDTLSIGTPANNATIEAELTATRGFNITGTSDPNERLFVNGNLVRDRTVEGFFFVHVPVAPGVNEFTFTQEGQTPVTRTITRNLPTPPPPPTPAPTVTQVTA